MEYGPLKATYYKSYQKIKRKKIITNLKQTNKPPKPPFHHSKFYQSKTTSPTPNTAHSHLIMPINHSPTIRTGILLSIGRHRSPSRSLPHRGRNRPTSPIITHPSSGLRSTTFLQCEQLFCTERLIMDLCGRLNEVL